MSIVDKDKLDIVAFAAQSEVGELISVPKTRYTVAELITHGFDIVSTTDTHAIVTQFLPFILPQRNPLFSFSEKAPLTLQEVQPSLKKTDISISDSKDRSWFFSNIIIDETQLFQRLAQAIELAPGVKTYALEHAGPNAEIINITTFGSYLWSQNPRTALDLVVVVNEPSDELKEKGVDHHYGSLVTEQGDTITFDMVLATAEFFTTLQSNEQMEVWKSSGGQDLPIDLSKATLAQTVSLTCSNGFLIYGQDIFSQRSQNAPDLLAFAHYFISEASIYLAYKEPMRKTGNRIFEANLILNQVEKILGLEHTGEKVWDALRNYDWDAVDQNSSDALFGFQSNLGSGSASSVLDLCVERLARLQELVHDQSQRISPIEFIAEAKAKQTVSWVTMRNHLINSGQLDAVRTAIDLIDGESPATHWAAAKSSSLSIDTCDADDVLEQLLLHTSGEIETPQKKEMGAIASAQLAEGKLNLDALSQNIFNTKAPLAIAGYITPEALSLAFSHEARTVPPL